MEKLIQYLPIFLFSLFTVVSFASAVSYAREYRKNISKVVFYTFLLTFTLFITLLAINIRHIVIAFELSNIDPMHTIVIILLTFANQLNSVTPALFVAVFFLNRIPPRVKSITSVMGLCSAILHVIYQIHFSNTSYFLSWCALTPQISFTLSVIILIILYKREKSIEKKKIIKPIVFTSLILFPPILIDNIIPIPKENKEGFWDIFWYAKPLFFVALSLILLIKKSAIAALLSPVNRTKEIDHSPFSQHFKLTPREHEVVDLVLKGFRNRELANLLGVKEKSIENHLTRIYRKCEVTSRVELMHEVINFGY